MITQTVMFNRLFVCVFVTALTIALSLFPISNAQGAGNPVESHAGPKPANQDGIELTLNGPATVFVPEDTPIYTTIAQYDITIENISQHQNIASGFDLDGEDSGKYSIDPGDGTLYPTQWLDFERNASDSITVIYWLKVAEESYQESIEVTINVEDVEEPAKIHKVMKANPVPGIWSYGGHALSEDPPGFVETEWANWGTILRIEVIGETHDPSCVSAIECVTVTLEATKSGDEQEVVAMRSVVRGDLFVAAVKLVEHEDAAEETEDITWADGVLRELELLRVDEDDKVVIRYGSIPETLGVENELPEFSEFEPEHGAIVDDRDVHFRFNLTDSGSAFPEPEDYPDDDGDQDYTPVAALVHDSQCYKSVNKSETLAEVRGLNLHGGSIYCDGQPNFYIITNDGDFDETDDGFEVDTELELPGLGTYYVSFIACDRAGNCTVYEPDESDDVALARITIVERLNPTLCDKRLRSDTTILGSWDSSCLSSKPALSGSGDRYARFFYLVLELESDISIELHSEGEPYLYLLSGTGTDGEIIAETDTDDSSAPAGARIERTLAPGRYTIEATTYASEVSGEFTIRVKGIPTAEQEERAALTALYNATNGDNWHANGNWLTDAPLSRWLGVSTNDNGRVIVLKLSAIGLSGEIPAEIGLLDKLETLVLDNNELTGIIPPELVELDYMETLSLGGNQLSGEIPFELDEMDNLVYLDLGGNQVTGEIPFALTRLRDLEELDLGNNKLTGEIPPELARLSELDSLWLGGNRLTGRLPPESFGLARIETLDLSNNKLTGSVPVLLSYLPNLTYLELDNNRLSGEIPHELGNLSHLGSLTLSDNELNGCVPESLVEVDENDLDELGLPFCEGAPSLRSAAPISDSFGTFADPVPLGTPALAPVGIAIQISSPILDANEVVENWEEWAYSDHESPKPGNKFIITHVRAQDVSSVESDFLVSYGDFGVVSEAGQVVGRNCSEIFGWIGRWLDKGESSSGILCFEIPEDVEYPTITYRPELFHYGGPSDIIGFWALTEGEAEREDVEHGTPISNSYGTRDNPVPFGEKALAADGYSITVLSVGVDAEDMVEDWHIDADRHEEYDPPGSGNRYVVVHARAENIEGNEHPEYDTTNGFLDMVTSTGKKIQHARRPCLFAPEGLDAINTFEGGRQEGYVCFEVPNNEQALTLYYENGWQPRRVLGFWALSVDIVPPVVSVPATPVSGDYGTRANSVPLGEKAQASDGIAMTVISADLDATELPTEHDSDSSEYPYRALVSPGSFGPPAPGNKYVIAIIRVEGKALNENELEYLRQENFGLVTSSGYITYQGASHSCEGPYAGGPYIYVFNGAHEDAALCYEVPIESSGLNIYYTPTDSDEVLGFWALSDDGSAPFSIEAATPVSDTYGSMENPVSAGERAATSDGMAISITSNIIDLSEVGEYPVEGGRKTVVVRARAEDIGGDENTLRTISGDHFGIVGQSGTIIPEYTYHMCSLNSATWDLRLYGDIFKGGWQEGLLCFSIPVEENSVSIFYKPAGSEQIMGYWEVPPPKPPTGATLISDDYGTLANPVPIGEAALAANGIDITVLSVTPNAIDIIVEEAGSDEFAPAPGNRYVTVRVRAQNFTGFDEGIIRLWARDFGIVTSSGLVIPSNSHRATRCDVLPDRIKGRFLGDTTLAGNLCFQVPVDEDVYGMFYAPRYIERVLGIWQASEDVSAPEARDAGTAVSDRYGTRSNPVPIGDKAVTSNGAAITVISVDANPGDSIVPWTNHHQPRKEGVGYMLVRMRIEGEDLSDGSLLRLHRDDFGIVSSSGMVLFRDRRYGWDPSCKSISREVHESVTLRGGFVEGDLCFQVPSEESGWTLFYSPGEAGVEQGFWALSDKEPDADPVPDEPPASISETYGSWSSPVPLGETARASNGITVTVLDVLDQDEFIESIDDYYPLPLDGRKYVAARVRIENFADSESELLTITHDDFGILLSPGRFVQAAYHPCGTRIDYDIIYFEPTPGLLDTANLFKDGQFEGYLCFQVPLDETARSIFYRPGWTSESWPGGNEPALGFWSVLEEDTASEPSEAGMPISDTYGTRDNPVPAGEKAQASDGIAIAVVSSELDATDTVEDERTYNDPPAEGNKYAIVRVRVENTTDDSTTTLAIRWLDFGIATASDEFRVPYACGVFPDSLELRLFGGMVNEGNLCFEIPANETDLTLFYKPGQNLVYDERVRDYVFGPPDAEVLGFWTVPID